MKLPRLTRALVAAAVAGTALSAVAASSAVPLAATENLPSALPPAAG
jgi:hypothetical protein